MRGRDAAELGRSSRPTDRLTTACDGYWDLQMRAKFTCSDAINRLSMQRRRQHGMAHVHM